MWRFLGGGFLVEVFGEVFGEEFGEVYEKGFWWVFGEGGCGGCWGEVFGEGILARLLVRFWKTGFWEVFGEGGCGGFGVKFLERWFW